jgi:hypothetical protein
MHRIAPVDPEKNAYDRCARPPKTPLSTIAPETMSAAELDFDESFGPIVDIDGGFAKRQED